MTIFTLIAAVDKNGGIGHENGLPWQIPEDLKHFRRETMGKPVIMGRKTFESIGRPLPQRHNIVISRNTAWHHDGVSLLTSVASCKFVLKHQPEVFVIGGSEIYELFLPHAKRIVLTEIDSEFKCDAFFPAFDRNEWTETSRQENKLEQYPFEFSFVRYERK
jgi:dihydrofolate reductase